MRLFNIAQITKTRQEPRNSSRISPIRLIWLIGLIGLIISPINVEAAAKRAPPKPKLIVSGEKIIQSDNRLIMNPGEIKTVKVGFKNTSKNIIWRNASKNYASLYTIGPRYRKSAFADKSWLTQNHVGKLATKQVKPGEIGYFEFRLRAPDALGDYVEDFGLALENLAWVQNAIFEVRIKVVPRGAEKKEFAKNNKNLASPHEAALLLLSHKALILKPNEEVLVRFGFKNNGSLVWNNRGLRSLSTVRIASVEQVPYTDWFSSETPVYIKDQIVKPGEIGFVDLPIRAPRTPGQFTLQLALIVDDQIVNGGEIELPAQIIPEAEPVPLPQTEFTPIMEEPIIRVGLEKTHKAILITADQAYEIRDSAGNPLGIVPPGIVSIMRFDFKHEVYSVETGAISYSGPNYLRFLPTIADTIFEVKSMERRPSFNSAINDNKYRGALEIRLSQTGNLWVINELLLEQYLRGLAEARDSAPLEFQKAQAIAARNFAYYNIANGGKYKKGYFDLTWTPDDQVYRGYVSELRMPNLVRGATETRGLFVTYDGKVVTTPYFAKSRGKTKTWARVWGGRDKPWLQSVSAPADEGTPGRGHGVGMSQTDAIWRAEEGATHEEILKYYYSGVELKKLY